ncbi:MAG: phage tail protein [Treponema sp.]|jgi:hypothetical protein|nr:phage tail protein [Treponema sp.]
MADFRKATLTAYGAQRIVEAQAGEKMLFTSIGLGSGILPENMFNVNTLVHEDERFPISGYFVDVDVFRASCHITSIEYPEGIYLREMGLYIADPEFENSRLRDHLFAVTGVPSTGYTGLDYVIYIPKNSNNTIIDYTFTINTQISPSAEIIIQGGGGGTGILHIAAPDKLGGITSSDLPGQISVNQDTGKAMANSLDTVLTSIANKTIYTLPVADIDVLGGLKSSLDDGCVAINTTSHIGEVVGYKQLKEAVIMLKTLEGAFTDLRDMVCGDNPDWLTQASLSVSGITRLSSTYSPSESLALTPKALDDFRQELLLGVHLPSASQSVSGIVQLVDNYTTLDSYKAVSAKAVCDLFEYVASIEIIVSRLVSQMEDFVSIGGGTLTGPLIAGGVQDIGVAQVRNIVASTVDLTAGVSALATGQVYLVYE